MRHLLQRVCGSIREHDSLQASLFPLLDIPYQKMPSDVMDAILHDPSAVIGHTRNARGWRAVEEVHLRVRRQRETLQSFVQSHSDTSPVVRPHTIFNEPVAKLMDSLEALSAQHDDLAVRVKEVAAVLGRVKAVQSEVKKDYNDTLTHTSLVYPEVRHSVARLLCTLIAL